jgi:tight adherence protein B
MIESAWVLAGCLLAGAVAVAWPARGRRRLDSPHSSVRLRWSPLELAALRTRVESLADGRPRRLLALAAGTAALVGWVLGGPVAAVVCAVYALLATRSAIRRTARRRYSAARAKSLDDLCALAADLRAGLPPAVAAAPTVDAGSAGSSAHAEQRIAGLTAAVWRLAERTGAPAAELVERIEADARTADRGRASAQAQAAGAQATALLLAALPLGGIALGYGIGVDPLRVLLHTTLGAACAVGAVLLQSAGLLWADRLASGPVA